MKRPVLRRPLHAAELWAASVRTLRPARRRRSHVPRPRTSDLGPQPDSRPHRGPERPAERGTRLSLVARAPPLGSGLLILSLGFFSSDFCVYHKN